MSKAQAADFGMAPPIAVVATCSLNQWVLDFEGNKRRILESVRIAKEKGCRYRLGPELEITGYSCEDHFYELDTMKFAWKILGELLLEAPSDILCDYSMPVLHNGVRYNCRVFCLNKKILLIRPKMWLADDGNYREERWFTPWSKDKISVLEDYVLGDDLFAITGQRTVKFGVAIIEAVDATIASEVCEELFTPESPNIMWGLEGVDIISNGSGSHWQMGKRTYRHSLISGATSKNGGAYMYSNLLGCEGNRLVFDGNSMIYKNGKLLAVGEHLSFNEVEVVTASINLDDVRAYRSAIVSRGIQADRRDVMAPRIMVEDYVPGFRLTCCNSTSNDESPVIPVPALVDEEEMGLGLSRYMWDYLCRSTAGGFFLPLSGGVDSGSTSLFVYYMCNKICEIVNMPVDSADKMRLWTVVNEKLNTFLVSFGRRPGYAKYTKKLPTDGAKITTKQLVNIVLHTCNMPTKNNTEAIRAQASDLARALGSYHITTPINNAFIAAKNMVADVHFGYTVKQADIDAENLAMKTQTPEKMMEIPRYKTSDGDWQENLAIQNVQARLRMITAYYMAQILPLHRWNQEYGGPEGGVEGWADFYAAKKAALVAAQSAAPGELEEKLSFASKLSGPDADLQAKIRKDRGSSPFLLVLASSNADEALRGFFTKYDAGSADLNPIGSFAKTELRKFMKWIMTTKFHGRTEQVRKLLMQLESAGSGPAGNSSPALTAMTKLKAMQSSFKYSKAASNPDMKLQNALMKDPLKLLIQRAYKTPAEKDALTEAVMISTSEFEPVDRILNVTASPELTPTAKNASGKVQVQDDEIEIELTYQDLYELGLLRKRDTLGPYSMFLRLCKDRLGKPMKFINLKDPLNKFIENPIATPTLIAEVVKRFFNWYGKNRSKMTILTPGIHATNYSPDDNRFDQRPFLYPLFELSYQYKLIKKLAEEMEANPSLAAQAQLNADMAKRNAEEKKRAWAMMTPTERAAAREEEGRQAAFAELPLQNNTRMPGGRSRKQRRRSTRRVRGRTARR